MYVREKNNVIRTVVARYPRMAEYAEDVVADAFLEVSAKYPDKTERHIFNIWRLASVSRTIDLIRKRKNTIRLCDLRAAGRLGVL